MNLHFFAAAFAISFAGIAGAFAIGNLASKTVESIARQPEASNELRTTMIIAIAFIEATVLYSLVISFMILAQHG